MSKFETYIDEIMDVISEQTACVSIDLYPEGEVTDDKLRQIEIELTSELLVKLNKKMERLKKKV